MVPFCLHAVANTPAGRMEFVRSYDSTNFGLPPTVASQNIRVSVIRLTANSAGCSLLLSGQFPPCPDARSPATFHQTG
jgi:hypothetical protein